jgi:muconolactone delta-isomerase
MTPQTTGKFSANEKEIARLLHENGTWKAIMADITQEINFLNLYLSADIFGEDVRLQEDIEDTLEQLEYLRRESLEIIKEIHHHRYDIEGILECEDIGCEVFYHEEHIKLGEQVQTFGKNFQVFKLRVFLDTGKYLKQHVQQ